MADRWFRAWCPSTCRIFTTPSIPARKTRLTPARSRSTTCGICRRRANCSFPAFSAATIWRCFRTLAMASSARVKFARSSVARPASSNALAASRRRLASLVSTFSTSSSLSSRADFPATSSLATAVSAMRSVRVRTSSRAFIAAVRSARSRSFSSDMCPSCPAAPDRAGSARQAALDWPVSPAWHHVCMRPRALIGTAAVAGTAVTAYATVVERNWFTLRRFDVPVLASGARPLRILHISDTHLTPGRHRLLSWIRTLDALEPDLVVNTGDSIAHPQAVRPLLDALGPLLDRPGVFVYGSNDLYTPKLKNPTRYLWGTSAIEHQRSAPDLPWAELGDGLEAAGWLSANNRRGRIKAGDLDIEVGGVHDSHIARDRYDQIGRAH